MPKLLAVTDIDEFIISGNLFMTIGSFLSRKIASFLIKGIINVTKKQNSESINKTMTEAETADETRHFFDIYSLGT
jgi:hypothetical protein